MSNIPTSEEEEAYRLQLREQLQDNTNQPKKKGVGVIGCLFLAIGLPAIVLAITLFTINPAKEIEELEQKEYNPQNIQSQKGSYQSLDGFTYNYDIVYEKENTQFIATFSPFLPQNDANLFEASFKLMEATYGNNSRIIPTPILEPRQGKNVIKFNDGTGKYYYVYPIKEDSGEVHTIIYWKE